MESPQYWDRLTATLATVELRDLDAVWSFLSHSGVIEHERRGAFDQVVSAVTSELERGVITGPSIASRIATRIRGLQTARGAQPDPEAAESRSVYASWVAARASRRSGPIKAP